ncbi:hypothetical protein OEZ86_011646 [Tetradesmus obliquus]|uniref:Sulfotransferase n=1 Tax=Tetradesmus obliquus TaxID=3088 RepID=A0A383V4Z8_TETOB|nr:hypothetical protein OEZ86_011646 [Tetradesmus obliquus]|eukprot:jgi/Sobl393_1/11290/SZX60687.1
MDVLKCLLAAREEKSPQVQALLTCLDDPSFNLQVCICSVGGVGSTQLSNFLTRAGISCNLLTDQDGVRHVNRPPSQLGPGTCLLYLFGDPLAAVASHYRRNQAYHQALKTSGNPALDESTFPQTFQEYVSRGKDLFGLQQHLHHWLHTPTQCDILFVRYERMFDLPVAAALFSHICKSPGASALHKSEQQIQAMAAEFSSLRQQRASRVSAEQRQAMYVQLAAEVDALPAIFVRGKECHIVPLVAGSSGNNGSK